MGSSKTGKLIKIRAQAAIKEYDFSHYVSKSLVIDLFQWLYRFKIEMIKQNKECTEDMLLCLWTKINKMLLSGILPIVVTDGKPPDLKRRVLEKRREKKEIAKAKLDDSQGDDIKEQLKFKKRCASLKYEEIDGSIKFMECLGFSVVKSRGEADPQCAGINIADKAYGVISDDWDTLIFGAKKMITNFNFNMKSKIVEYDRDKILSELDITQDQFVELAIVLGCDYCDGISVVGVDKEREVIILYEKYKEYGSLENLLAGLKDENRNKKSGIRYIIPSDLANDWASIKAQFIEVVIWDPQKKMNFQWNTPNYTALREYFIKMGIDLKTIDGLIDKLKEQYSYYVSHGCLINRNVNKHGNAKGRPKKKQYKQPRRNHVHDDVQPADIITVST
jgi:flap endonuclease-1